MQQIHQIGEEELVRMLKAGSHAAFEEIYHRYKGLLISHAYKKLGSFEDAKEMVQELFSRLWINHTEMPETNNLIGYLYVLLRNRVLNQIAHQQIVSKYESSFRDFVRDQNYVTDLAIREKEMKALIQREIDALPPKMREVFLLRREQYLSNKDIAAHLGISEFTVKNHMKAALKVLRSRLGMAFSLLV